MDADQLHLLAEGRAAAGHWGREEYVWNPDDLVGTSDAP